MNDDERPMRPMPGTDRMATPRAPSMADDPSAMGILAGTPPALATDEVQAFLAVANLLRAYQHKTAMMALARALGAGIAHGNPEDQAAALRSFHHLVQHSYGVMEMQFQAQERAKVEAAAAAARAADEEAVARVKGEDAYTLSAMAAALNLPPSLVDVARETARNAFAEGKSVVEAARAVVDAVQRQQPQP